MKRWPPILWLAVFAGSLLIVRGSVGGIRPPWLIAGGAVLTVTFFASAFLALRPGQGPMRPLLLWSMVGLAALYVAFAAGAALSGGEYAVAALLAGTVPMTGLNLWVATVRQKTDEADGELRDRSIEEDESPYPGVGLDDDSPLGSTPELSTARDDEVFGAEGSTRPTRRFRRLQRRESIEK